jgi:hypothetical protein
MLLKIVERGNMSHGSIKIQTIRSKHPVRQKTGGNILRAAQQQQQQQQLGLFNARTRRIVCNKKENTQKINR